MPNVSVTDLEINLEDNKLIAATFGRGIWQTDIEIQLPNYDIKLVQIQSPNTNVNCSETINPVIQVKNNGLSTISNANITYLIDGNSNTYNWTGTILSNQTQTISLPTSTLNRGVHTLEVTSTITDDAYADNNSGQTTFYINDSGTIGQTNAFTNPTDELITYTEASNKWIRGIKPSGPMSTGSNIVYTTNLTGNYSDETKAYIVSQCYNLSSITNPQIQFSMQYDLEDNWDVVYVEYSTNMGQNWSVLGQMATNWYNSDRTPQTAGDDCFNCPGAQWTGTNTSLTTYSYPLTSLIGQPNVIFRIVFHSDAAENKLGVNVDDFVINGVLSNTNFQLNNISIYPNPTNGVLTISLGDTKPSAIEVYDLTGKLIVSKKDIVPSNFETTLDLSSASQGIYFVKIVENKQQIVKRIIKQ